MRPPVDAARGKSVRLRIAQHWPIVALSFVPLLIFRRTLLFGETLFYQDLAAQYFPREQLLMRTGPTGWNPHIFLGMSLIGDPQTAAYEPVRALARLLGLEASTGLVFMLTVYLIIAGLGVYLFALRKGASPIGAAGAVLAAIWGGLYIVRFRHPPLLTSMCMIPWAALAAELLLAEGTLLWALVLALVIAVGALGGGPQGPYMLWSFVATYLGLGVWVAVPVGRRLSRLWSLAWRSAVGASVFLGLIAVQYLPVALLIPQTARHETGVGFVGAYSLSPSSWAHLVVPDLYGNDMNQTYFGAANYHEQTVYLGIVPLLLLALAVIWRRRVEPERSLLVLVGGWFVVAAGRFLPAFYFAYWVVPGWRLFRCPARYCWFFAFAAAVTIGVLISRISRGERPPDPERVRRLLRRIWAPLAGVCLVIAIVAVPFLDRLTALPAQDTVRSATIRAAILLLASGLVLDAWLRGALSGGRTSLLLVSMTAADLALQWLPYRQTRPPVEAFPDPAITRALADASPGRVLVHAYGSDRVPEIIPLLNWGEAAGYDDLRGYNQLVPSDLLRLFERADVGHLALAQHYALAPVEPADWLLDLSAVRRIVARPRDWPEHWRTLPLVASDGTYEVRERPGKLPRAWLVGAALRLSDPVALDRLPQLDLRHVATVDSDVGLPAIAAASAGQVRWLSRSADDLSLEVRSESSALLVLSDRFAPGWDAEVDGRTTPVVRTDYLLRGVRLEPGLHTVKMHFTLPGAVLGRWVTLLTAVSSGLLLALLALLRRARAANSLTRTAVPAR